MRLPGERWGVATFATWYVLASLSVDGAGTLVSGFRWTTMSAHWTLNLIRPASEMGHGALSRGML